jgi:hypothetical protein
VIVRANNSETKNETKRERERERERKRERDKCEGKRGESGASGLGHPEITAGGGLRDLEVRFNGGEHLVEYVPVIIGRDNDRVAASCLWRDCRSRR